MPWFINHYESAKFTNILILLRVKEQKSSYKYELLFNPIQDGLFRGYSRMGGAKKAPLSKICHSYPTMMKLGIVIPYPKKIKKIYKLRDTLLEFC